MVVDGLVISPWSLAPPRSAGRRAPRQWWCSVNAPGGTASTTSAIDNVAAAREATRHLIGRGRAAPPRSASSPPAQRYGRPAPAPATAQRWQRPAYAPTRVRGRRHLIAPPEGRRGHDGLLEPPGPPDAVFCFTDELALGALRAALEAGLRVPGDLSLVGFDDIEDGRYSHPRPQHRLPRQGRPGGPESATDRGPALRTSGRAARPPRHHPPPPDPPRDQLIRAAPSPLPPGTIPQPRGRRTMAAGCTASASRRGGASSALPGATVPSTNRPVAS